MGPAGLVAERERVWVEISGERVRALRERAGLRQKDLADRVGIGQPFLSEIEKGRRQPSLPTALQLARALGVEVDQLVGGGSGGDAEEEAMARGGGGPVAGAPQSTVLVPIVRQLVRAGAGGIPIEQIRGYLPLPEQWGNRDLVALEVIGTCLEPILRPGDYAVVERGREPRLRNLVVVLHEGETLLKYVRARDDGEWVLSSHNEPDIITNGETKIQGVVVQVVRLAPEWPDGLP